MYDIQFLTPTRKEVAVAILIVFVLLVGAGCIGYCIGLRNVHDNGSGVESVGQQLDQAGTNISNANQGISNAENHAGNIEAGIGNAQESADYLQGTVSTSAELINQCQQIIARIRQRGETHPSAN